MKALVIEDDHKLCEFIVETLEREGYVVDAYQDGETGFIAALNPDNSCDIAVIDRMLPVIDGLSIIKAMREKGIITPTIIITGMSAVEDRIEGLDHGADDYLVKPFYMQELLARVRALIRRPAALHDPEELVYGDLTLERDQRKISCAGVTISLTGKEMNLMSVFMKHPGKVFSREQLLGMVWGSGADVELGNVDNYISFLRKRLRQINSQAAIKTMYGAGYIMERIDD